MTFAPSRGFRSRAQWVRECPPRHVTGRGADPTHGRCGVMSSYQVITETDSAGVRRWRVWRRELVGVFDTPGAADAAMAADRDRRAHCTTSTGGAS